MPPLIQSAFQTRKPGLSPAEFNTYYETIYLPLLVSLQGSSFLKSHTRSYVIRTACDASSFDTSNSNYRASVYYGTDHQDIDYDIYSEMIFEDEKAFKAFEKVMLEDQQNFQGPGGLKVVGLEVLEATLRPSK
ncbi:uncharacterized protein EAF01_001001 [Botrytis porri]|uniref:EthD domain-containing protein n=1 Tax=Botrytis porri TaxID=87229 RepID=A0A4Z1KTV6_9HELO|nr:uncharacterized protein EAF01_001001 [Botrytis porri]KAF7914595.1 hypothetical protein EAF01_001001 [Botrytis porri]TGO87936.1 hypothetical protein BPOR_0194g00070 [Botrytis porri]